ncbi:efflux RND transporter periplasmic adaptor subunit [Chryseosolibacter indicus]|uniref:Efflux RND transporter periplasmic adaptor subunit n=1 Tax=Chryseosolibacter indicus TaxID=2782351 RepID=A0ABS5VVQ5_9BACT|nr:efflux RND transporter periplasmic adaptor subunit [Chryseosolibacter indicus]MBT1705522.1 efflux RND transporter periplasmic adaptor subunit [Chryseosolibacter indicus]
MRNIQYAFFGATLILLAHLTSSCSHSSAHEEKKADENAVPVTEVFALKKEKLSTQIQLPGELIAFQSVDLYAKVTGFVKELKVDIGSEVKTGQVLVTLEAPELMSQMTAAESRLKSQEATYTASNANYKRLLETSKTPGTISQNDLDLAEAKKNSDYANLEAARAASREVNDIRNYLVIRAPFDGIITVRNVNPGAYVGPSGKGSEFPIFTLQQQKKLRLVVSIPEAYTGYLDQGSEVAFKVRSLPAETFKAKVVRMAKALDLKLRSERVEFDIENKEGKLLPGSVADVSIPLVRSDSSFVIPKSALLNSSEGLFVIKVSDNKAERVAVKKALEANSKVEIFGALSTGDQLVLKASDEIRNGTELKGKVVEEQSKK